MEKTYDSIRTVALKKLLPLPVAMTTLAALLVLAQGCATSKTSSIAPTTQAQQQATTPAQALERLEAGNARFVSGQTFARDWAGQRAATAKGQHPFAVVLGCIDSRASAELIFDQGVGDVFSARVAGNVLNDDILGSMEFACKVAGARLIAVIGHTQCGAVKGACSDAKLGHLTGLLERIQPAVADVKMRKPGASGSDPGFVEEVALRNVELVQKRIREQSPVLRELIDSGKVGLVGGIYDLESGRVNFLKQ